MGRTAVARIVAAILFVVSLTTLGATVAGASTSANKPKAGGTVIQGAFTLLTMDPGAAGFSTGAVALAHEIFGSLFDPPSNVGTSTQSIINATSVVPDLALTYSYGPKLLSLTLTLRHGVKFSDGTPFNAAAVAYNFNRLRTGVSTVSQYFDNVGSVTTKGDYTVTMHFITPMASMIYVLDDTPATLMVSPAALQSQGAAQFGQTPVGAGPFKVVSYNPGESMVLQKNPTYWDARHVYLNELEYLNTGTDTQTEFDDLASNSIQSLAFLGAGVDPTVLAQAKTTTNVTTQVGPNDVFYFLAINTYTAPFNNQLAREAIDYCTDRNGISKYIYDGFALPAYVKGGTAQLGYPSGGWKGAEKIFPYPFDPTKGTQLVSQIPGGVSFQILNGGGQNLVLATALSQGWASCGIKATIVTEGTSQILQVETTGQYQMAIAGGGGNLDPGLFITYDLPTAAPDSHGFNLPTVTNLIEATNYTTNLSALSSIWERVWAAENKAAVAIPLVNSSNYYFNAKCLKGAIGLFTSDYFDHAYYACTP